MRRISKIVLALAMSLCMLQAPAAEAADRPNTMAGATTPSSVNTVLSDTIASSGDVDWFRFKTTTSGYSRILLNWLPANYRIRVYNAQGGLMTGSARAGRAFEEVYRYFPAGTYFVQVTSQDGTSSSTSPYRLQFRPLTEGLKVLSATQLVDDGGDTWISGEVLNNTRSRYSYVEVTARFYNTSGQIVKSDFTYADLEVLAARTRSPFSLITTVPDTAVRYTVTLSGDTTSDVPFTGLVNHPGPTYSDEYSRYFPGEVVNNNTATAQYTEVYVALYDSGGAVRFVGEDFTSPTNLAKGQVGSYELWTPLMSGITFNRYYLDAWPVSGARTATLQRPAVPRVLRPGNLAGPF